MGPKRFEGKMPANISLQDLLPRHFNQQTVVVRKSQVLEQVQEVLAKTRPDGVYNDQLYLYDLKKDEPRIKPVNIQRKKSFVEEEGLVVQKLISMLSNSGKKHNHKVTEKVIEDEDEYMVDIFEDAGYDYLPTVKSTTKSEKVELFKNDAKDTVNQSLDLPIAISQSIQQKINSSHLQSHPKRSIDMFDSQSESDVIEFPEGKAQFDINDDYNVYSSSDEEANGGNKGGSEYKKIGEIYKQKFGTALNDLEEKPAKRDNKGSSTNSKKKHKSKA